MSEQLARQFEPRYNVESEDPILLEMGNSLETEETQRTLRGSREQKYYYVRRKILRAHTEKRISDEERQQLETKLNIAARAELGREFIRKPDWGNYTLLDNLYWAREPDGLETEGELDNERGYSDCSSMLQLPNGNIIWGDNHGLTHLWNESMSAPLRTHEEGMGTYGLNYLADGRLVFLASVGDIYIIDPNLRTSSNFLQSNAISFAPAGDDALFIQYARSASSVHRYTVGAPTPYDEPVVTHSGLINNVYYDQHRRLITTSQDGIIKITDPEGHLDPLEYSVGNSFQLVKDLSVAQDGKIYFIRNDNPFIYRIDPTGPPGIGIQSFRVDLKDVEDAARYTPGGIVRPEKIVVAPSGNALTVKFDNGWIIIYDINTGKPLNVLQGQANKEYMLIDDNRIIADAGEGRMNIWGNQ